MFNAITTLQTCKAAKRPVNCELPGRNEFETNPDIAGIGVVSAYELTALLTLAVASLLTITDFSDLCCFRKRYERLEKKQERPYRSRPRRILEPVILSFSDQQLITGLAMQIAVQFLIGCDISAYHYDIVCNIILMSLVTHLASLAVVSRYFSNWVLGPIRAILIIISFGLTGVMFAERDNAVFPTGPPSVSDTTNTTKPYLLAAAACFTTENVNITDQFGIEFKVFEAATRGDAHVSGLVEYVVLFIITIFGLIMAISQSIITSSSRNRVHLCARQWILVFRVILLLGAWAIAVAAFLKFNSLRNWLADSPWPKDNAEHKWDFGQLLPCFLLSLAPLAFIEAYSDYLSSSRREKRESSLVNSNPAGLVSIET